MYVKITVTSKMVLIAYVLWIAVGITAGAYVHNGTRGAAMTATLLALIACTVHIRAGQRRVSHEICLAVGIAGLDQRVTQIARARGMR